MSHLCGKFAGILRAELPSERVAAATAALAALEARGLKVIVETAARAAAAAPSLEQDLELIGLDCPGIVRDILQLLASNGVNVEELIHPTGSARRCRRRCCSRRAPTWGSAPGTDIGKAARRAGALGERPGRRGQAGRPKSEVTCGTRESLRAAGAVCDYCLFRSPALPCAASAGAYYFESAARNFSLHTSSQTRRLTVGQA